MIIRCGWFGHGMYRWDMVGRALVGNGLVRWVWVLYGIIIMSQFKLVADVGVSYSFGGLE